MSPRVAAGQEYLKINGAVMSLFPAPFMSFPVTARCLFPIPRPYGPYRPYRTVSLLPLTAPCYLLPHGGVITARCYYRTHAKD